jgi:hypothetical protein
MTVTNIENTAVPSTEVPSTFSLYSFPLKQESSLSSSSPTVADEDDGNSADSMIGIMDECYTSSSSLPPIVQLKEEMNHEPCTEIPASKVWEQQQQQSTQLFTLSSTATATTITAEQEPSSATVKRKNSRRSSIKLNNNNNNNNNSNNIGKDSSSTNHVMGSVSKQNNKQHLQQQSLLCNSPTAHGNTSVVATTPKPSNCRQQSCSNCHVDKTPLWRKGADGNTLCNKCGLYWSRHGKHRPIKLDRSTRKPPSRKNSSSTESPTKTSYDETPHTPKLKKKSPGVLTKRVHSPSTPTKTSKRVKKSINLSKSPNPSFNEEDSAFPSYLSSSSLSSSDEDEQACFEHFLQQSMPGFNSVSFMDTQLELNQTAASTVQAIPNLMSSPSFISAGTNPNDLNTIGGIGNSNGANPMSMFGESGDASILNTILFHSNSDIGNATNPNTFLQLMQQSYQEQQQIIQQQQQQLFEQTHAVTNIPGANAVDLMGNQNTSYPINFNILFDNNSFGSIEEHDMIFSTGNASMEDIVDMNQFSNVDNNRQLLINNVSLDPNCISINNSSNTADQLNISNSYLSF